MSITRDDWLRALNEAGIAAAEDDQGAITVAEYMALVGVQYDTARRQLRGLVTAGKATQTFKRTRGADGRSLSLKAFRLVP